MLVAFCIRCICCERRSLHSSVKLTTFECVCGAVVVWWIRIDLRLLFCLTTMCVFHHNMSVFIIRFITHTFTAKCYLIPTVYCFSAVNDSALYIHHNWTLTLSKIGMTLETQRNWCSTGAVYHSVPPEGDNKLDMLDFERQKLILGGIIGGTSLGWWVCETKNSWFFVLCLLPGVRSGEGIPMGDLQETPAPGRPEVPWQAEFMFPLDWQLLGQNWGSWQMHMAP